MRVLFVGPGHDDFLADGLFHGLRTLLGADAVDWPRIDHLYADYPLERRASLHGLGFTLAGLLGDDSEVDRTRALYRAVDGRFDLVVFADILRTFGLFTQWFPQLRAAQVPMAVIDTGDRIEPYPWSGVWWRKRWWWTLPRAHRHTHYFKREITPWTYWYRTYLTIPGPIAVRLPLLRDMIPISFSIPASYVAAEPPEKTKDWPAHVVDPEVAPRVGAQTAYAFADADAYHADLRASRFGVTTKKAGWDALRHYEIAAAGAVPCFRDLDRKPGQCAPYGLSRGNAIIYSSADDLLRQVAALDDAAYAKLQCGTLAWAKASTTEFRARAFLRVCGL
jgi:hypothetical protein